MKKGIKLRVCFNGGTETIAPKTNRSGTIYHECLKTHISLSEESVREHCFKKSKKHPQKEISPTGTFNV